jgi:cytochrome c peroxidase
LRFFGYCNLDQAHLIQKFYGKEYQELFEPPSDLSRLPLNAGPVTDPAAKVAWDTMPEPDRAAVTRIYANIGKAIEAYKRHLLPGTARFDRHAEAILNNDYPAANQILSLDEVAGLKLFFGDAHCTNCHNGLRFTNNDFHNTGDAMLAGQFKPPLLRSVANRAP